MNRGLLIFILLSGCVRHLQTSVIRRFHVIQKYSTWTAAQRYCRQRFTDLATINNWQELDQVRQKTRTTSWIGLSNTTWGWTLKDRNGYTDPLFSRWAAGEPKDRDCVTTTADGAWMTRDCGSLYHMVCYNGDKHILVRRLKSWVEARTFCRDRYRDLSSIYNQTDNNHVSSLLQDLGSHNDSAETGSNNFAPYQAWIGLFRHAWTWSDGSTGTFRPWAYVGHHQSPDCAAVTWYYRGFVKGDCRTALHFICYSDVRPVLVRRLRVSVSGPAADLEQLQSSVLTQLQQHLEEGGVKEEVKLWWRRWPDGEVFHREQKEQEEEHKHSCL